MKPSTGKEPEFQPSSAYKPLADTGSSLPHPNVLQTSSYPHTSEVGREGTLVEERPFSVLTPTVDAAREFLEIATDFSNPLDLIREAISNSIDANASEIHISFNTEMDAGERILICEIEDNGEGMNLLEYKRFLILETLHAAATKMQSAKKVTALKSMLILLRSELPRHMKGPQSTQRWTNLSEIFRLETFRR
jgi:hypothetical protein